MDEWIDYYDSTHTIYASKLHRDLHFHLIAKDIIGYIASPDAVVLDYACGEALFAAKVAEACGKLILAEPAPGVRGRLIARFAPNTKIRVRSLDDLRQMVEKSVDLVVMNSAAQYMTPAELDAAFAVINAHLEARRPLRARRYPAPGSRHGQRRAGAAALCLQTRLSERRHGRADQHRAVGLPALRTRVGLQRYSESEIIAKLAAAGFTASRAHSNIGYNPWRMTFVARHSLAVAPGRVNDAVGVARRGRFYPGSSPGRASSPLTVAGFRHSTPAKCRLIGAPGPFAVAKSGLKTSRAREIRALGLEGRADARPFFVPNSLLRET